MAFGLNYNALAIGFGPTERTSEAILALVFYPKWVSLFFLARIGRSAQVTQGSGNSVRHIVLQSAETIDDPGVEALIEQALATAKVPMGVNTPSGKLVIKSVSEKQRPRRPAKTDRG
jgi:hypothetical protein